MVTDIVIQELKEELEFYNIPMIFLNSIYETSKEIPTVTKVDKFNADLLANKFLVAADLCSEILTVVIKIHNSIRVLRKNQEGLSFLERSLEYCQKKELKPTDTTKGNYVDIDSEVIRYRQKEGSSEALKLYLMNKREDFLTAHYLCKTLYSSDNMKVGEGYGK